MKRLYVAGPMSNLPAFNYPAFHAAAAQLRAVGFEVENPADNPVPHCGTWLGYMRMALTQLARCDGVVRLPGWEESKGAAIECDLAERLGMPVMPLAAALFQAQQYSAEANSHSLMVARQTSIAHPSKVPGAGEKSACEGVGEIPQVQA